MRDSLSATRERAPLSSRLATVHSEALPGGPAPARAQHVVGEGPDKGRAATIDQSEVIIGTDAD
jgi:hypothetical protein